MAIRDVFGSGTNMTTFGAGGITKSYQSVTGKKPGYSPLQDALAGSQPSLDLMPKPAKAGIAGVLPTITPITPVAPEPTPRRGIVGAAAGGGANVTVSTDGTVNVTTQQGGQQAVEPVETPEDIDYSASGGPQVYYDGLILRGYSAEDALAHTQNKFPEFGQEEPGGGEGEEEPSIYDDPNWKEWLAQMEKAGGLRLDQALAKTSQLYGAAQRRLASAGGRGFSAAYASQTNALTRDQLRAMSELVNSSEAEMAGLVAKAMWAEREFQREDEKWWTQYNESVRQFNEGLTAQIDQWATTNGIEQGRLDSLNEQLDLEQQRWMAGLSVDPENVGRIVDEWAAAEGIAPEVANALKQQVVDNFKTAEAQLDLTERSMAVQENVASFNSMMQSLDFFATTVPEMAGYLIEAFISNLGTGMLGWASPEMKERIQGAMPEIKAKMYVEYFGDNFNTADELEENLRQMLGTDGAVPEGFDSYGEYVDWIVKGMTKQWSASDMGGGETEAGAGPTTESLSTAFGEPDDEGRKAIEQLTGIPGWDEGIEESFFKWLPSMAEDFDYDSTSGRKDAIKRIEDWLKAHIHGIRNADRTAEGVFLRLQQLQHEWE